MNLNRRDFLRASALSTATPALFSLGACGGGSSQAATTATTPSTRTWKMGFAGTPPIPDTATLLHGVDLWSTRAELAVIHDELPWTALLSGTTPDAILIADKVPLVTYYRNKGLQIFFMGDLTDGMARQSEAPQLLALGRSITEPAVQQIYRNYMLAAARLLTPDYLGFTAETNLVRALAPAPLYAAMVQTANASAADVRAAGTTASLMCSVQVEAAWGLLSGNGPYVGIARDLQDFAFVQTWGLSSYPYFAYAQPENIPSDYYSRLLSGSNFPAMVSEGGWTSASVGTVQSTPDTQARYLQVQAKLLDSIQAKGLIQLLYADLNLSAWPQPQSSNLSLFAHIGLTDASFGAKPALAAWDTLFVRRCTA